MTETKTEERKLSPEEIVKESTTGDTYVFTSDNGVFRVSIKREFLKTVAEPAKAVFHELMSQHNMGQFLHNENGPAMLVLTNGHEEFWLDGKRCSADVAEKIKHSKKFFSELEEELGIKR